MPTADWNDADLSVLIVDDEALIRRTLSRLLRKQNWRVGVAASGPEAMRKIKRDPPDLVILDIMMPGPDGMEVLDQIRAKHPGVAVVMHTAFGDIEIAVKAIQAGAADFLEKPCTDIVARLRLALEKTATLERKRLEGENRRLAAEVKQHRERARGYRLVGDSPGLVAVRERIERVAGSDVRVLITGESGTGKEVAARLIHKGSSRTGEPFVELNCAAIPEELIEAELFGAERGSYTGADRRRIGKFEQAHRGTLFLDEVGDMSANTQAKVLRALEEGEITRVGGSGSVKVDVRVLAATNQDLSGEGFRDDLYHRLAVIPLAMPPLRDRPEDIPLLVAHFLEGFSRQHGYRSRPFTEGAFAALTAHPFPGNVRELRNLVECLLILSSGDEITDKDVRDNLGSAGQGASGAGGSR